ncbi:MULTISPECIES: hypothetical protein [Flavobacterium]|uniref:LPXTG cell wall anchor domain-containing protein n=1 Tax=Flavobacterium hankyongi TaxID=1176532 RepID=A0ABP8ZLB8_9FLAO|nr:hypothetical protein [Flavobacterium sp. N1846]
MNYLKYTQYAYLVAAAFFIYDGISKFNSNRNQAYLSLLFALMAVGMFFFRKKFAKKFEDRNKNQ